MGHRSRLDLLTRERAALGDEANLFRLNTDNAATVQNDHDDLLAGECAIRFLEDIRTALQHVDQKQELRPEIGKKVKTISATYT